MKNKENVIWGKVTCYERVIKRIVDIILSTTGMIILAPLFLLIALIIIIDDPGTVIFSQKRVGKKKEYFKMYKFRTMKMSAPHDIPTHLLDNPDQYITNVGRILRKYSLDELPQLFNILIGDISIIGPRPALWNQDDLVMERDKYGANDVMPGLTGWAQINGRDELEIPVKAKLDGDYVERLRKSSLSGMVMDVKCFFGTIASVLKSDGVVEGGTGEMKKSTRYDIPDVNTQIGFGEEATVDFSQMKKVLITGANSYIGKSFENYVKENYSANFEIDTVDMIDGSWREKDFSGYDTVFHVAGMAHADVGKVSDEVKDKYYAVNTDLAIETAKKAKKDGVKQFVFMSSMIVYGESAPYGKQKMITADTKPEPANFYGDSKWQADKGVRALADEEFNVVVLRPPMIYGKGSKGNYPTLAKLAKKLPVFPDVDNQRSMLYIDNLCEFLCQIMLVEEIKEKSVVLIPQNSEWTKTSQMVKEIAEVSGKKIRLVGGIMKLAVSFGSKVPGKIGGLVNKAFGNSSYDLKISIYPNINYQIISLTESIKKQKEDQTFINQKKSNALILASVASMIEQFNMQNIQLLLDGGYNVDVACNCKEGSTISDDRIQNMIQCLTEKGVSVTHVPIPRKISDIRGIKTSLEQVKKMCDENHYDLLHCHSPIGSVIARLAAKDAHKKGTKVIYTAHGFHFYKGAPKKNWLLYYPIEKMCSKLTDVLITINKEDYDFAKNHMNVGSVEYIPGIGVDTKKFLLTDFDSSHKREELGITNKDFLILSVGELNANKNQEVIIKAIAKINDPSIHYFIAGKGDKDKYLEELAEKLNVNLHLLGYRTDIVELLNTADIYAFPSYREGLSVALMEAMAAGLPCVVSKIRGNVDLIDENKGGYLSNPSGVADFSEFIEVLMKNPSLRKRFAYYNSEKIKNFDICVVRENIVRIYDIK